MKSNQVYQSLNFKYNDVFDTKENVKKFIESNKDNLNIYIDNYNRLLGNSKLFRTVTGHTFGTYHVTQLQTVCF